LLGINRQTLFDPVQNMIIPHPTGTEATTSATGDVVNAVVGDDGDGGRKTGEGDKTTPRRGLLQCAMTITGGLQFRFWHHILSPGWKDWNRLRYYWKIIV